MIGSLQDLSPAARDAARAYLAAATKGRDDDVAAELIAHLTERLEPDATAADVARIAAEIGPLGGGAASATTPPDPFRGTFLGVPYNWHLPTLDQVTAQLWEPADRRLWRPRLFGAGWDLNFGALAVRTGLIEPDAEDVPLDSAPDSAFVAALVPAAVAAKLIAASYLLRRGALPGRVQTHWTLSGRPDRFTTKGRAAGTAFALAAIPAAAAATVVAARPDKRVRAAAIAGATGVSLVAASSWVSTLLGARGGRVSPMLGPVAALVPAAGIFAVLAWLSRVGRAAEIRRDLAGPRHE